MIIAEFEILKIALIEKETIKTFSPLLKTLGIKLITPLTQKMYLTTECDNNFPDIVISTWADLGSYLTVKNHFRPFKEINQNINDLTVFIWGPENYDTALFDCLNLRVYDLGFHPTIENLYLAFLNIIERVKSSHLLREK